MENAQVLTKKKAHRRKPGGKRKKDKNDRSLETMSDEQMEEARPVAPPEDVSSSCNNVPCDEDEPSRKHFRVIAADESHKLLHSRKLGRERRLLRPAKVPKAPQNSTQFIIDDHENSAYFIDFEKGFTSPGTRDDVGWSPYFEQDFDNVYRTTKEAEIIDWTHEVLVDKISSLEERVKTLEQQLSMCDPNVYMTQMQHRIVCTRDENRQIKEFRVWCPMHGKKVRLRNPSSESSSAECSSSSSESQEEGVQNGDSDDTKCSEEEDPNEDKVNVNNDDKADNEASEKCTEKIENAHSGDDGDSEGV